MASLCCQAEVVLLVVHRQDAHLVLCCYEAPHLLGEVPNPLLLMCEYEYGDGGLPDKALTRGISSKETG